MLGSSVLEVAIGLALFFFLLAIIVTSINEVIARVLKLRANTLRSGIGELLSDPTLTGLAKQVYEHPLIAAQERTSRRPSYIHGRTFAAALIDTISQGAATVAEVHAAVAESNLPGDLKRQLLIVLNDAGDDITVLRRGVATWFDDSMERVSGWYKRKTQVVTAVVGLVLVLLLNADALSLADGLLKHPAAREAFVAQASALTPTGSQGVPDLDVEGVVARLEPLGFGIGWSRVDAQAPLAWFANPANWLAHVPGWVITVFALLLGAPFWFDVLTRASNIRSAGKPPPTLTAAERDSG